MRKRGEKGTLKLLLILNMLMVSSRCNKVDVPLNKVFSKTVRDKFNWAIAECEDNEDFEF